MKRKHVAVAAAVALVAAVQSAQALTYTYSPTNSATDVWSAGTNWAPGSPVSAIDTRLTFVDATGATAFAGAVTNVNTDDVSGAFQLNLLDLGGKGSANAAEPASITIAAAAPSTGLSLVSNVAVTPVVNLVGTNGAGSTLTYNVSSPVDLTNNTTFAGSGTAGFNFNGVVGGGGNLTKTGSSTLVLGGDNTFTGNVSLGTAAGQNSGAIRLTSSTALGQVGAAKTITSFGGSATTIGAIELTNGITIDASKTINKNSSTGSNASTNGFLRNVSGNNAFNGNITITGGGTSYVDSASAGNTIALGGLIRNGEATSGTANVRTIAFDGAGNTLLNGAVTSGPNGSNRQMSLIKLGTGTLTLDFASASAVTSLTITGGTVLSNGIGVGATSAGGTTASVTVNGGTLGGTASVGGAAATVTAGGAIAPGSPATPTASFATGSTVTFGNATTLGSLNIDIAGSSFAFNGVEQYDRLKTGGTTTLTAGFAALNLSLIGAPAIANGDLFGILDAGGGVVGTFNGLAEGASVFAGGQQFKITYLGNVTDAAVAFTGGNDVVLQAVVPEPTSLVALGGAALALLGRRRRA